MGYLVYDSVMLDFTVSDRLLAHLQIVIINKFRKNESFTFSWKDPDNTGDGRSCIWLSPAISLRFKFAGSRNAEINPTWLAALYEAANSGRGLHVIDEPTIDPDVTVSDAQQELVDWDHNPRPAVKTRAARPLGS